MDSHSAKVSSETPQMTTTTVQTDEPTGNDAGIIEGSVAEEERPVLAIQEPRVQAPIQAQISIEIEHQEQSIQRSTEASEKVYEEGEVISTSCSVSATTSSQKSCSAFNPVNAIRSGNQDLPLDLTSHKGNDESGLDQQNDNAILNVQNGDAMLNDQVGDAGQNEQNCQADTPALPLAEHHGWEPENGTLIYGNRTLSSFDEEGRQELMLLAARIYPGATFKDYQDFSTAFEALKIVDNAPYRIGSSERLRDGQYGIVERFKYKYAVFQCAHYGKPRMRGRGMRQNQNYLPNGCKAKFRLVADTAQGCLKITSWCGEHVNHEQDENKYLQVISRKRKGEKGNPEAKRPALGERNTPQKNISTRDGFAEEPQVGADGMPHTPFAVEGNVPLSSFLPLAANLQLNSLALAQPNMLTAILSNPIMAQYAMMQQPLQLKDALNSIILHGYSKAIKQHLPEPLFGPFMHSLLKPAHFSFTEWTDAQLGGVLMALEKPPEEHLGDYVPDLNAFACVRNGRLWRGIAAVRKEKLNVSNLQ